MPAAASAAKYTVRGRSGQAVGAVAPGSYGTVGAYVYKSGKKVGVVFAQDGFWLTASASNPGRFLSPLLPVQLEGVGGRR